MVQVTGVSAPQSKAARQELALSQKDVIAATGINAYKLKLFEARNFDIGHVASKKLREFYEAQGVDFAQIDAHLKASQAAQNPQMEVKGVAEPREGFTFTPRPGFRISGHLPETLVDKLMDQLEVNDNRIGELTEAAFKTGFLGGITEETEAKTRELLGVLAENHVIFRCLQGRNIIAPTRDEPKTIAEFLTQMMKDCPVLPILVSNGQEGKELVTKGAKPPEDQASEAVGG